MKSQEVGSSIENFASYARSRGNNLFNKAKFWLGTTAAALSLAGAVYGAESVFDVQSASAGQAKVEVTNDYPDKDAWDCTFPFGVYSWCKGVPASPISPRGYNYRNCTDWVVWRERELTGVTIPKGWGNASYWANSARGSGYSVATKPEKGDIAHWYGNLGHVAVVERVNPNGTVNVSEYNYNGNGYYDMRNNVRADDYIDLNGVGNGADGTGNTMDRPLAVADHDNGEQDVFWRSTDSNLWEAYYGLDGRWHGPIGLGMGPLGSAPTAVWRPGNNEQDVFWQGTDGQLWRAYYNGSWHGPDSLGKGPLGSQPAAAAWGNEIDVFWKGTDNNLWETWQTYPGGRWNGPVGLGMGPLGSAPSVTAHANGEQDVFWKGTDNNLWEGFYSPSAKRWYGSFSLGMGPLGSAPSAVWQPSTNEQKVYWQGTDQNIWGAYYNGTWHGANYYGKGPLGSAPSAGAYGGETEIFWRGQDSNLWETWSPNNQFSPLAVLGFGPIPGS